MRSDFCIFILTNGRANKVHTYKTLKGSGYNGKIYIVIDDEDKTADEYKRIFGDKVLTFCKSEIGTSYDEGDNFKDHRTITYARNACFELAKKVGCKYFIELDDDYKGLYYRFNSNGNYGVWRIDKTFGNLLELMVGFLENTPAITIALSQGGDHIGGAGIKPLRLKRKAMNSFVCSTEKPFQFTGRLNEDVNTYTSLSRKGVLFFTVMQAQVNQLATQSNAGLLTEAYKDNGTYVKSFYSVMYSPSCVKITTLSDPRSPNLRIHHNVNWNAAAPLILSEDIRKARNI